ncbi:GNAT family N-acetyltransferase [Panacibacter sp. DH6]|uniref:GNAT family N-acetyltransferase n=1 Tax=Panacibacter microcysteis TaxID=2793269 RepID=A0A931E7W1_9BACT|nr:GNAT family N-acetyltransferase [Panacibacter microcysteis]MBG9375361.1 GNAT family N-acetyltransferase [Panacibacter microcysteis]
MNEHYEVTKDDYCISTDQSKLDIDTVYNYIAYESYWAQGITKDVVEKSVANSLCFGLYKGAAQIGFARLVTDKATFAYLADVFVLEAYRGKGLSKWLMQVIHAHPGLQTLRRWLLGTRDAHGLYEQFGWTRFTPEIAERFMQKHNPGVYTKQATNV